MKKIGIAIIAVVSAQFSFAQQQSLDLKNMKPEARKEVLQRMDPNERMELLRQYRENMIVTELNVPQNTQPQFKSLYNEYQEKQSQIKGRFNPKDNYESMSDAEATKELDQSFEVGQQLLDTRKDYSQKFMKVISPQQVLKMYQTEGKMRKKILDRKQDGPANAGSQRRRP